ncbi:hypothetical protein [Cohnella abietis]|uniref:Uncharacterized protein n=1 Tax=Cohnella abietis TaxID=2507935 RepID=A0A3T1D1X1_9BACL|nr:hypothetical protein [Cohnella abietis]BBI32103.1 hypothetical protein KCTCHS21_15020 [Cohnella abietis]
MKKWCGILAASVFAAAVFTGFQPGQASAASAKEKATANSKASIQAVVSWLNTKVLPAIEDWAKKNKPGNGNNGNGNGNNGNGNNGNGNNGNGNGNNGNNGNGNNGNGNGNNGNNGNGNNGNGNNGNNGNGNNGNGNNGNNGNGNGNNGNGNGNNGNGNGNGTPSKEEYNKITTEATNKLISLQINAQHELTSIALRFKQLKTTHEKSLLYKEGSAAFADKETTYTDIINDTIAKLIKGGHSLDIIRQYQAQYQNDILFGQTLLKQLAK